MAAPTLALTACMSASTPAGCEECAIGPYSTDASRDVPTLNDLADVSPRDFAFLETSKDVQKMFTGNVLPFRSYILVYWKLRSAARRPILCKTFLWPSDIYLEDCARSHVIGTRCVRFVDVIFLDFLFYKRWSRCGVVFCSLLDPVPGAVRGVY